MSSRSRGDSLTVGDVDKLTLGQAMEWMQKLQLSSNGSNLSLQTARLILKKHLDTHGSPRGAKPAPWADRDTTTAALKDDQDNRKILFDLYTQTETYVNELPKPFQDALSFVTQGKQLSVYKEELKTSQLVLLFAGDVGSGKSSLINLLLGVDLLPTSELRCTAAIVEVSWGPIPQAMVHWRDDSSGRARNPIKFQCDSVDKRGGFLAELEKHIVLKDDESDESPYEKIELQWPLDMLKGGVVIVDSPGVGGRQGLPQHLADYMDRAFGFVYVIDSTTGIHKHRLGQLLLKAVEANDGFEASTTLFVCNKWDRVPPDSHDRVKTVLADKLSMIVEDVKPSQLYPISVTQSKEEIQYDQVSANHRQLIAGIRKLLPQSMKGKLKFYYRHLSTLIKRSLYSLRMSHNMQRQHVDSLRKNQTTIEARMKKLEQDADNSLKNMKWKIHEITAKQGIEAVKHLDSMKTKYKLLSWGEDECPKKERNWQSTLKTANLAIADKVAKELNSWEQSVGLVNTMQAEVIKIFQAEFALLDNEMDEIGDLLLGAKDPKSENMNDFTTTVRKTLDPKKNFKAATPTGKTSDDFKSLGVAVSSYFSLDPKEDGQIKTLFKDYGNDPCKAMSQATELYLNMLSDAKIVAALTRYFNRFVNGIDRVGNFIPEMMKTDQKLLHELDEDLKSGEQKLVIFPKMNKKCANIQGALDMFYVQKLLVPDFSVDQLVYNDADKVGVGSFATVYKAGLKTKNGNVLVAVKDPVNRLTLNDVTDVLLEEVMLRDLEHENFVKYYGVCRKGPPNDMRLIMVMEFCPYTLKSERIDKGGNAPSTLSKDSDKQMNAIEVITNFLIQICTGVCFLHSKSIVHRDLKPANILLTADSRVRIADLGLAKTVMYVATHGIGTPVYMAPEILCLYMKYNTKADIYSLAMIMWELWYGEDLADYARNEIQGSLKTEIEHGWRPTLTRRDPPTKEFWAPLISKCWEFDPELRLSADIVRKSLVKYYKELRSLRSRQTPSMGSTVASSVRSERL